MPPNSAPRQEDFIARRWRLAWPRLNETKDFASRLRATGLRRQETPQVRSAGDDGWMLLSKRSHQDGQGLTAQLLGLCELTACPGQHGHVVQRRRDFGVIGSKDSLLDCECFVVELFCRVEISLGLAVGGKVVQDDGDLAVPWPVMASQDDQ